MATSTAMATGGNRNGVAHHHQGIWSTMKHLMHQGRHHHRQTRPPPSQQVHALAGMAARIRKGTAVHSVGTADDVDKLTL
jgi:hypothetical protein